MDDKATNRMSIRVVPVEEHGSGKPSTDERTILEDIEKAPDAADIAKSKGSFFVSGCCCDYTHTSCANNDLSLQRILTYGDALDWACMTVCTISAVGAGIAMPLMFLVFGKLVGDFTGFLTPAPASSMHLAIRNTTDPDYVPTKIPMTKEQFMHEIDQNT